MTKKRRMPLMIVLWQDHSSSHDWLVGEEIDATMIPPLMHSIGWLCRETKDAFILAATVCEEDGATGQTISILKSAVVKKCRMKQPESWATRRKQH